MVQQMVSIPVKNTNALNNLIVFSLQKWTFVITSEYSQA